ncbi:MAG: PD40 domain-containing protein [Verrucomicrobiales bacterium]|nr:PD40 domain-containing protein [Verrucomicrobiales bacterium]
MKGPRLIATQYPMNAIHLLRNRSVGRLKIGRLSSWRHLPTFLGLLAMTAAAEVRLITGDANGALHQQDTFLLDLSGDGNWVLFSSGPPPVGSTPGFPVGGLYLRDLRTGALRLVPKPTDGDGGAVGEGSISDDGRYVAWHTAKFNVYWQDTQTGESRLLTSEPGKSRTPILSADGRYVAYVSVSRALVSDPAQLPAAGRAAVYVYDAQTRTTTVGSLAHDGHGLSSGVGLQAPSLEFDFSADGRFVFFATDSANVHPDRAKAANQAYYWSYRRHLETGQVDVVCRNSDGVVPAGNFSMPRCDGTGNRVLLLGGFVGLGGGPTFVKGYSAVFGTDLYAKDVGTGEVWRLSKTTDGNPPDGPFASGAHAISRDGKVAAFASSATKLVGEPSEPVGSKDTNPFDVFKTDLRPNGEVQLELVTRPYVGTENVGHFMGPFLPGDGRYVAFVSRNHFPLIGQGEVSSIWEQGYAVGTFGGSTTLTANYSDWAQSLPEADRGLLAAPRADGISNLQKFVFGMAPTSSDGALLPRPVIASGASLGLANDSGQYLTLTVRARRGLPAGYGFAVRAASRLGFFGDVLEQVGAAVADGEVDVLRFRLPEPIGNVPGSGFLRIDVFAP